jgi:hypothetical protein
VTSYKRKKKQKERQDLKQKVITALAKGNLPDGWNANNLKHMVQWYTLDGYAALAKNSAGLVEQYEKTKHHIVEDVVVVCPLFRLVPLSPLPKTEPIAAAVVLHVAAVTELGADVATTTTTGLGAPVAAAATAEQEPIAAAVVLRAAVITGLGAAAATTTTTTTGLGAAASAVAEQEPIAATVVLRATTLEGMAMAMTIEPTNRGLEEAKNGLEEEDKHEEQDTTLNLIPHESDDEMSDDDADILEDLYNE